APRKVIGAQRHLEPPRNFRQHLVSHLVTVGIVDLAQVIDIGEQSGKRHLLARRAVEFVLRGFEDEAVAVETGNLVMRCARVGELLQRLETPPQAEPQRQFLDAYRLAQRIVRADCARPAPRVAVGFLRQENNEKRLEALVGAQALSQPRAVDAGHKPVEDRELGNIHVAQAFKRFATVSDAQHFDPVVQESLFQFATCCRLIAGNQRAHVVRSLLHRYPFFPAGAAGCQSPRTCSPTRMIFIALVPPATPVKSPFVMMMWSPRATAPRSSRTSTASARTCAESACSTSKGTA